LGKWRCSEEKKKRDRTLLGEETKHEKHEHGKEEHTLKW
jgi:hypothetical protein